MKLVTDNTSLSLSKSQSLSQDHRLNQYAAKLLIKFPRLRPVAWQPCLFFSTAYSTSGIGHQKISFAIDQYYRSAVSADSFVELSGAQQYSYYNRYCLKHSWYLFNSIVKTDVFDF